MRILIQKFLLQAPLETSHMLAWLAWLAGTIHDSIRVLFIRTCMLKLLSVTGGPSSSCEMIILRNKSHNKIIRVCMGINKLF